MIEHNLFEMENYRELIDEVGVDKFRERFEELQKTAMEFIQFRDYSEEERDIFINERFAAYLLINECLMCGTKHFVQEAYAEKLVEYTEMLLYYFKYRQCDPKTLELLIESFKMGGLVH